MSVISSFNIFKKLFSIKKELWFSKRKRNSFKLLKLKILQNHNLLPDFGFLLKVSKFLGEFQY
ncbi:hypothetical protein BpHYR1_044126 [Brachionus plicatilis]|uniref:Uncharacterized protein n=1 Tax=Brachionus plicatilis TaxID=10195 RepID=A0A3M7SWJ6_BRAPC|nr:hypothetical protein BpHYR1_044126 [Brachionus plicatilis]